MEVVFEFIFSFLGEVILQIVVELLFELGLDRYANRLKDKKERNICFTFVGYVLLGGIAGLVSLMIFPELMLTNESFALANLLVTPLLVGLLMGVIGRVKSKRGHSLVKLDSFAFGFVFALAMALSRFMLG